MYIFVDESGTFTLTDKENAWCAIAAFVLPESKRRPLELLLSALRFRYGRGQEVKLGAISEGDFVAFLNGLAALGGIAFAVAVDVSLHRREAIQRHQDGQVQAIRRNIARMHYEEGRRAVADLADEVSSLPLQLYTQLALQTELFHTVLCAAPLYYVQRHPVALGHFRWRVDQKDRIPGAYEKAFKRIVPALLQTKSLRDPHIFLKGADYSHFKKFLYQPGTEPTYLQDAYGLDLNTSGEPSANLGKIIYDDFSYVDSQTSSGVQVADLLASGVRRVLRSNFDVPEKVALALGANMVQGADGAMPVRLLSLDQTGQVEERAANCVRLMSKACRRMLPM